MFVVFDMDGTLSDPAHRLHHLEDKDWDSFYDECGGDAPIEHMCEVFHAMDTLGHKIEIWTGRRESCREDTENWLDRNILPIPPIRMRANDDHRHDVTVKGEWIEKYGRPDLVFEDRNSMVKFYRDCGIPCVQVAEGDF